MLLPTTKKAKKNTGQTTLLKVGSEKGRVNQVSQTRVRKSRVTKWRHPFLPLQILKLWEPPLELTQFPQTTKSHRQQHEPQRAKSSCKAVRVHVYLVPSDRKIPWTIIPETNIPEEISSTTLAYCEQQHNVRFPIDTLICQSSRVCIKHYPVYLLYETNCAAGDCS